MGPSVARAASPRPAPTFDLVHEPWIPCERPDGRVVALGIEEALVESHALAAVHDTSPLVTAVLYRLLLAVLYCVFGPKSMKDWLALWHAEHLDAKAISTYLKTVGGRFDLFDAKQPFLQVAALDKVLGAEKLADVTTPAWRLAPERSQHCAASHLLARVPEDRTISPAEAARSLLAYQAFTAGGRIQNEPVSRKSGILRSGAVVLLRGRTLRETLLWNLTWHETRSAADVPPWERKAPPERTHRAPKGPVDMLVWPSRRVLLLPEEDVEGKLVVRDVITAAGEDMDGEHADPQFAYGKDDKSELTRVKMLPNRATWRDALSVLDPDAGLRSEVGGPGFGRPRAVEQLAALYRTNSRMELPVPIGLDLLGLVGGGAGRASSIRDWHTEVLPLQPSLLTSDQRLAVLRTALAEAEEVADALRVKVLYALAVHLVVGPDPANIDGLRESLGTIPAYWQALGAQFNAWLTHLGERPPEEIEASLWTWRGLIRQAANNAILRAIEDIGLAGRAIRAGLAAERVLAAVLADLVPIPEGVTPEMLPEPRHEPPVWSDTTKFVPALMRLIEREDLGALAALRMSLATPSRIWPEAKSIVEPLLPPKPSRHVRRTYYLVAAFAALHRGAARGASLGAAMRRLHDPSEESDATTERFDALMTAHADDIGELVSAVLPLVYEKAAVDWELLLHDLIFWGRRDRLIQRGWAKDFYEGPPAAPPVSSTPTHH